MKVLIVVLSGLLALMGATDAKSLGTQKLGSSSDLTPAALLSKSQADNTGRSKENAKKAVSEDVSKHGYFPGQREGLSTATLVVDKPDYEEYTLVWHDEFSKDGKPDDRLWNYEEGFVRNKEAQWYQRENATCRDGFLIIEGRKEVKLNPHYEASSKDWRLHRRQAEYTSASLTTKKKFAWLYGRFECRGKFLPAEGMWPAFWTVGLDEGWPACGEIDIMEYYKSVYLANLCWGTKSPHIGKWSTTRTPVSYFHKLDPQWNEKFHIYRMDWDEHEIRLYIDDILLNAVSIDETNNQVYKTVKNPFRQPHQIILNLAMGATGGSLENLPLPQQFVVDYVRVYQKKEK